MTDNELVLTSPEPEPDYCIVQSVQKIVGTNPRCALCFQREGNPGDCCAGDRFAISFGAVGGVILCREALADLVTKIESAEE